MTKLSDATGWEDKVASLDQLRAAGYTYDQVRWRLKAGRWQSPLSGVVILHSGPPTRRQREWAATLWAGEGSALCAATAAELNGLRGYSDARIHVCVPGHRRPRGTPTVVVHRSGTLCVDELVPDRAPARVVAGRSLVELAAGKPNADEACAALAAGVQQGLASADELVSRIRADPRVRHRAALLDALVDIAGGSESHAELLAVKLIRRFGLPEPRRQARVVVNGRLRLIDLYWDAWDAGAEILGDFHRDVENWWADRWRNAQIQSSGTVLIELPARALRREPERAMTVLRAFLISRGWQPGRRGAQGSGPKTVL
jgi:hypothetical protein